MRMSAASCFACCVTTPSGVTTNDGQLEMVIEVLFAEIHIPLFALPHQRVSEKMKIVSEEMKMIQVIAEEF
jgi:hypothetical protein